MEGSSSLITCCPMTIREREWVTWHILWKAWSHLILWPTGSEWHCTFCERQSHHIFSYDQQEVSDIAHFVKDSLITSFPMVNRLWVTSHILWRAVSSHLSYEQQVVSAIAHFNIEGNLIKSIPVTNRKWVIHWMFYFISLLVYSFPHVWRQEQELWNQGFFLFFCLGGTQLMQLQQACWFPDVHW